MKVFRFKVGKLMLATLIVGILLPGLWNTAQAASSQSPHHLQFEDQHDVQAGSVFCNADEEITETSEFCSCHPTVLVEDMFTVTVRSANAYNWALPGDSPVRTRAYLRFLQILI